MIDEPVIEYGVKELLSDIRKEIASGFSAITTSMDGKADKSDLAEIRGELRGHADRIVALERETEQRKAAAEAAAQVVRDHTDRDRFRTSTGLTWLWIVIALVSLAVSSVALLVR